MEPISKMRRHTKIDSVSSNSLRQTGSIDEEVVEPSTFAVWGYVFDGTGGGLWPSRFLQTSRSFGVNQPAGNKSSINRSRVFGFHVEIARKDERSILTPLPDPMKQLRS